MIPCICFHINPTLAWTILTWATACMWIGSSIVLSASSSNVYISLSISCKFDLSKWIVSWIIFAFTCWGVHLIFRYWSKWVQGMFFFFIVGTFNSTYQYDHWIRDLKNSFYQHSWMMKNANEKSTTKVRM
jgi:hypothetical protein